VLEGQGVLDNETGLVWQRFPATSPAADSTGAGIDCAIGEIGGRHGWRIPNFNELLTIFDDSAVNPAPSVPAGHPFGAIATGYFWTSSIVPVTHRGVVRFVGGTPGAPGDFTSFDESSGGIYAWCVRGVGSEDPSR
jgi:hypothetical protein